MIQNNSQMENDQDAVTSRVKFYTHESKPFCTDCYDALFVPVCKRCNKKIRTVDTGETAVSVSNEKYHSKCFTCIQCNSEFPDRKAFLHDGQFYCRQDYDGKMKELKAAM